MLFISLLTIISTTIISTKAGEINCANHIGEPCTDRDIFCEPNQHCEVTCGTAEEDCSHARINCPRDYKCDVKFTPGAAHDDNTIGTKINGAENGALDVEISASPAGAIFEDAIVTCPESANCKVTCGVLDEGNPRGDDNEQACLNIAIHGATSEGSTLTVHGYEEKALEFAKIRCPDNSPCDVYCAADNACEGMLVEGGCAGEININCGGTFDISDNVPPVNEDDAAFIKSCLMATVEGAQDNDLTVRCDNGEFESICCDCLDANNNIGGCNPGTDDLCDAAVGSIDPTCLNDVAGEGWTSACVAIADDMCTHTTSTDVCLDMYIEASTKGDSKVQCIGDKDSDDSKPCNGVRVNGISTSRGTVLVTGDMDGLSSVSCPASKYAKCVVRGSFGIDDTGAIPPSVYGTIGWKNVQIQCGSLQQEDCYGDIGGPKFICYSGGNVIAGLDDKTTASSCRLELSDPGISSELWECRDYSPVGASGEFISETCNICNQCRCDTCDPIKGLYDAAICPNTEPKKQWKTKDSSWSKSSSSSWSKSSSSSWSKSSSSSSWSKSSSPSWDKSVKSKNWRRLIN